jgi:hypothetical protein
MLIVEYLSKSYYRFLHDMPQYAEHKNRFLITLNGAEGDALVAVTNDISEISNKTVRVSTAIKDKHSQDNVSSLFSEVRSSRDILLFDKADLLFAKRTAVKNPHEQDASFDINNFFKSIAKHNGVVMLSTEDRQTLSASMSSKVDVLIRF